MQWADPDTFGVLEHQARTVDAAPIVVTVTARAGRGDARDSTAMPEVLVHGDFHPATCRGDGAGLGGQLADRVHRPAVIDVARFRVNPLGFGAGLRYEAVGRARDGRLS